ncbi:hypothetical protein C8F01DRAFT_1249298 [Mycena amicta]|nr:hypothetical protein C8F01DRAFT_1249298 [Mycena amicta]
MQPVQLSTSSRLEAICITPTSLATVLPAASALGRPYASSRAMPPEALNGVPDPAAHLVHVSPAAETMKSNFQNRPQGRAQLQLSETKSKSSLSIPAEHI